MSCSSCSNVVERPDLIHVIRQCPACGREMRIHEPGAHGRGMRIQKGDRVEIPANFIQVAFNPLRSNMTLTRAGVHALAETLIFDGLPQTDDAYATYAAAAESDTDDIVNAFAPLAGLDIRNPDDSDQIVAAIGQHRDAREFWACTYGMFLHMAQDAISNNQPARAAWASSCAERARSMMVFKEALEEVVWMGHSAKRLIDVLAIWDSNRDNSDEEFWQLTFNENSYVLSQVFAVPMLFLKEKAYVGGMTLDRSDSRFVDYLFSAESSRDAILIEIKTPKTPLLTSEYRGNRPPSKELSGSVVQVLNYRTELARNLLSLKDKTNFALNAFTPRCAVLIGNAKTELLDENAQRSFELFRTSLKDVEIITYDELFRKIEILAELFRLKRIETKTA